MNKKHASFGLEIPSEYSVENRNDPASVGKTSQKIVMPSLNDHRLQLPHIDTKEEPTCLVCCDPGKTCSCSTNIPTFPFAISIWALCVQLQKQSSRDEPLMRSQSPIERVNLRCMARKPDSKGLSRTMRIVNPVLQSIPPTKTESSDSGRLIMPAAWCKADGHSLSHSHFPSGKSLPTTKDVIKADIRDPLEIIRVIGENEHLGFFYLNPAVPYSSANCDVLDLRIVEDKNVDLNNYCTVSGHGFLRYHHGDIEFTSLDRWLQEYRCHCHLRQIPFFKLFRLSKPFVLWHKNVRHNKFMMSRRSLNNNLFTLNVVLWPALLRMRQTCCEIAETDQVKNSSANFHDFVDDVVTTAFPATFLDSAFTLDEFVYQQGVTELQSRLIRGATMAYSTPGHHGHRTKKTASINQTNKIIARPRLIRFLRLVEYVAQNTLLGL
uniref:uncharacterized protein isoform X2 n=1 Tax=Myxine glutinosa TaxID=7769 RepID=UPI00358F7827